jgi:hypothetical protein
MWCAIFSLLLVSGLCYGSVRFSPKELTINIDEVALVQVMLQNETDHWKPADLVALYNERPYLASVDAYLSVEIIHNKSRLGEFNVTGVFLGTNRTTS